MAKEKITCSRCGKKEKAEKLDSYDGVILPKDWDALWSGYKYSSFLCPQRNT
jgi:hypothetical protein